MSDEQGKIRYSYLSLFRARRFLTIVLPLHRLGELLHFSMLRSANCARSFSAINRTMPKDTA